VRVVGVAWLFFLIARIVLDHTHGRVDAVTLHWVNIAALIPLIASILFLAAAPREPDKALQWWPSDRSNDPAGPAG
jgi:hypothetical protein